MTTLRLVKGTRDLAAVRSDEAHVELVTARAERLVLTEKLRGYLRSANRLMAGGHVAAAATYIEEASRLVEQESRRALASGCPDGCEGMGHGDGDDMAVAA
jgi:hypothetical protein